ncbi:MAG: hypothetical protein JWR69_1578 [Pedosphaera sp.]|nr:hypothetical protein [Pedosphaera sp.]
MWCKLVLMNDPVELLFAQLESHSRETAMESSLALACLLERALWPGRYESTHQLVLPPELQKLRLEAGAEVDTFILRLCETLASPTVSLDARLTISSVLGKTGRALYVKAILSLLEQECESLSDENLYGLLASIPSGFLASQPRAQLLALVEEYHTVSVLQRFSSRGSPRLSDSLFAFQSCLSRLQTGC